MGAVVVFTLVLYPYVYLLARSAFLSQGGTLVDAARGLGLSRARAIVRVACRSRGRRSLGGVALALMESLADFGTVNLLGVQSFPNAIYKVWFGAFDRDAALQLGTLLVSITLCSCCSSAPRVAGRATRGRRRGSAGGPGPAARARAAAALGLPLAAGRRRGGGAAGAARCVVGAVDLARVAGPRARGVGAQQPAAGRRVVCSSWCAATVLAYGRRVSDTRTSAGAVRVATIGYGLPGSVVAVAVIVPFGWLDHRLDDAAGVGLLITGTVLGLLAAYAVRFLALAFQTVDSALQRVPRSLDDAARGLGSDRLDILGRVHVPLISSALLTAALLVFTEVMKELPATLLLRPLGGDTLAIEVWHATTESLYETAALPALMIVLVGLLPVAMLIRLSRRVAA